MKNYFTGAAALLLIPFLFFSTLQEPSAFWNTQQNSFDSGKENRSSFLKNDAAKDLVLTKVYARSFGFSSSSTADKNTTALQEISAFINKRKGGVELIIDKGIYTIGREKFSGKTGKGYAFMGDTLLQLTACTQPVVIDGSGATLRLASGLHFGSFNPQTGQAFHPSGGAFYDYNYVSYPQCVLSFTANKSVHVKNITVDGNLQNFMIGGRWGDDGIQLPADAIAGKDNEELILENVTGKYMPRDGLQIGNTTPSEEAPLKKIFLYNCTFDGNARQGFSWVGGNHLYAENCRFSNTGKTVNALLKKNLRSSPSAGIDMEAELGLIRNGVFKNCIIDNNDGAGLLSVGDVADMRWEGGKIIGATNWSIYGAGPRYVFDSTVIVGSPVNIASGKSKFDGDATKFFSCLVSADSTLSPTGKVYGNYVMDFGGGAFAQFYRCTIDYANRGSVYGGDLLFDNCTFRWDMRIAPNLNGYSFLTGTFTGITRFFSSVYPGTSPPPNPSNKNSKFYGPFYINGKDFTGVTDASNSILQTSGLENSTNAKSFNSKRKRSRDTVLITRMPKLDFTEANLITANATPAVIENIGVPANTSFLVDAVYTGLEGMAGKKNLIEKSYLLKNTAGKMTLEKETSLQNNAAKKFTGFVLSPVEQSGSFMLRVKGTTTPVFWNVKWKILKTVSIR